MTLLLEVGELKKLFSHVLLVSLLEKFGGGGGSSLPCPLNVTAVEDPLLVSVYY